MPGSIIAGMSFYTRKGDDGSTSLLGKGRVPKYHLRIETLGTVDEATAALGLARASSRAAETHDLIIQIQRDLYGLMAEVATEPEHSERFRTITAEKVNWLEAQIDAVSSKAPIPKEFILPGDTLAGAALSLARTVVRRAERHVADLLNEGDVDNPDLLPYLNRLSSLCFALELLENQAAGKETSKAKESK